VQKLIVPTEMRRIECCSLNVVNLQKKCFTELEKGSGGENFHLVMFVNNDVNRAFLTFST
jgi:hypothetical protein